MGRFAILALLASQLAAVASDARLTELGAILIPMRANPLEALGSRGATPQFTTIKHRLRDWIESKLQTLPTRDAARGLEDQLNLELQTAGLVCRFDVGPPDVPDCPELTERGFLSPIKVTLNLDLLVIQTGVGIQNCGFDDSAYAYRWNEGWHRFWQSEQDDYTDTRYRPQMLRSILISPTALGRGTDPDEHLIVSLGTESWCTSNMHPVYYRVWQTKSTYPEPKLLLDQSEEAMLYFVEPIHGSVGTASGLGYGANDVWIEYSVPSFSAGTREEVRHYRLTNDNLERIDPVALGPRDFVDQWVRHRWDEKTGWTDPQMRAELQQWLPKPNQDGFIYPQILDSSRRCENRPDLWQVKVDFQGGAVKSVPIYFLVSWKPPFHFAMGGTSNRPRQDCTQPDYVADHFLTLFR